MRGGSRGDQPTLPQVHIPQTDLDLPGSLMWTIFTTRSAPSELVHTVDVKKDLVDDEDDELNATDLAGVRFQLVMRTEDILRRNRPDATIPPMLPAC